MSNSKRWFEFGVLYNVVCQLYLNFKKKEFGVCIPNFLGEREKGTNGKANDFLERWMGPWEIERRYASVWQCLPRWVLTLL